MMFVPVDEALDVTHHAGVLQFSQQTNFVLVGLRGHNHTGKSEASPSEKGSITRGTLLLLAGTLACSVDRWVATGRFGRLVCVSVCVCAFSPVRSVAGVCFFVCRAF